MKLLALVMACLALFVGVVVVAPPRTPPPPALVERPAFFTFTAPDAALDAWSVSVKFSWRVADEHAGAFRKLGVTQQVFEGREIRAALEEAVAGALLDHSPVTPGLGRDLLVYDAADRMRAALNYAIVFSFEEWQVMRLASPEKKDLDILLEDRRFDRGAEEATAPPVQKKVVQKRRERQVRRGRSPRRAARVSRRPSPIYRDAMSWDRARATVLVHPGHPG